MIWTVVLVASAGRRHWDQQVLPDVMWWYWWWEDVARAITVSLPRHDHGYSPCALAKDEVDCWASSE